MSDRAQQKAQTAVSAAVDTVQTLSKGDAPSNAQINATLDSTQEAIEQRRREAALNAKGDVLAKDTTDILQKTKLFLNEKNSDEIMQQLFYHSKAASLEAKTQALNLKDEAQSKAPSVDVKGETKDIQAQAQDIYYIGRRVAYEIVRSKDFRRILLETLELIQGVFWRKVTKEGGQVNAALKQDILEGNANLAKTQGTASAVGQKLADQAQEGTVLTEEEKRQLSDRLRYILKKIDANPDYQRAVNGIITLLEQLKDKATQMGVVASETAEKVAQDKTAQEAAEKMKQHSQELWSDVKKILERFTGEGSIDPVVDSITNLIRMIQEDPRAVSVFREGRMQLNECIRNPNRLDDPSKRKEFELLFDKARSLFNDPKYNRYSNEIFDRISELLNKIKEDEATNELGDAVRKFAQDLALDASGRPSMGALQDSLQQLKTLLTPVILKQLDAIPIARIEGSTKKYDFVIHDVVFSAYDVLPDYLRLDFNTSLNVDMRELTTDKASALLRLRLENIKSHLRNLKFAYRKKTFPKIEDEGIADVDISGDGININLEWQINSYGSEPMKFIVRDVSCDIDKLSVNIKEAQHSFLDKMMMKLFSGYVKRSVEDEIETNIRYFGRYIADQMNDAFLTVSKPKSA